MTVDITPVLYNNVLFPVQTGPLKCLLHLVFGYKCVCVLVNVFIQQECHMLPV